MKKVKTSELSKLLSQWDRQLHLIQEEWMRKKTPLRTKVYSLIVGLSLIGFGGALITITVIESLASGLISPLEFIKSFIGMVIAFLGYIIAHKGLEGTWL